MGHSNRGVETQVVTRTAVAPSQGCARVPDQADRRGDEGDHGEMRRITAARRQHVEPLEARRRRHHPGEGETSAFPLRPQPGHAPADVGGRTEPYAARGRTSDTLAGRDAQERADVEEDRRRQRELDDVELGGEA